MSGGDLVFVGDVHLDRGDAEVGPFCEFLEGLAATAERVVLMGDLFNLWLGQPRLEQPHQRAVAATLAGLRRRGVVVRYVEGNRDYRIGPAYAGRAFDDVATGGLVERAGDRRVFAIHGDLANPDDRRYRAWRRLSRTRVLWAAFNLLPRRRRLALAEGLEARLRSTNVGFKRAFPERRVRAYAASLLARGHDVVVLGHFHQQRELRLGEAGLALVLPEWKSTRRHLRFDAAGRHRWEGSGPAPAGC